MKEKILFVNSCVRGENESRTLALAKTALSRLDGDIEEIRLADANLKPLDAAGLAKRAESAEKNDFSDPVYDCAKQFAACGAVLGLQFPGVSKNLYRIPVRRRADFSLRQRRCPDKLLQGEKTDLYHHFGRIYRRHGLRL